MFRIVFNVGKEDVLGMHEKPVRCVEYSYAAGIVIVLIIIMLFHASFETVTLTSSGAFHCLENSS